MNATLKLSELKRILREEITRHIKGEHYISLYEAVIGDDEQGDDDPVVPDPE